ncbi:MAG: hypothetical protein ACTSWM_08085 [Alphaproteobacteria bacterium]
MAIENFDRFVTGAVPTCQRQPAQSCVDSGWMFIDTDTNGGISAAEVNAVRATMGDWFTWRQASLTKRERSALALGLLLADSVGLENLLAGFDANGDGQLTREELLADVAMDQRPLGEILSDPAAVDRDAVAHRLGAAAPLLNGMLR